MSRLDAAWVAARLRRRAARGCGWFEPRRAPECVAARGGGGLSRSPGKRIDFRFIAVSESDHSGPAPAPGCFSTADRWRMSSNFETFPVDICCIVNDVIISPVPNLGDLYAESGQTLQGSFSAVPKPNLQVNTRWN